MPAPRQTQHKMSPGKYARLMKLLVEGTRNAREMAQLTELHYITVLEYCRALHEAGLIHICAWERDAVGRDATMIYRWGPGNPDVPRRRLKRTPSPPPPPPPPPAAPLPRRPFNIHNNDT